ncbi:hypothetical protein AKJ65_02115 [candidate division MSBL1 archaeon SCGC-AAA259E19]|uniref:2Fe-2S ferredoxin-type domain-containing protein n=1 Tax=candidate division MSBL1 archaeon SCGC-AAA259E19 TaxID=1698264 RepID=A0A133UMA6_9EURY|nr:hypothetical protein AKJ65_02115 [candidate division MSBL1 archaeon SCGC-AAA259E19]
MTDKCEVIIKSEAERTGGEFDSGTSILEAAKKLGVRINSLCGGKRTCGKCKVIVGKGKDNISRLTDEEEKLLSRSEMEDNYRLACATRVRNGPVMVSIPKSSRSKDQIVLTEGIRLDFEKNPAVREYPLEVSAPSLDDWTADFERISRGLAERYGITVESIDYTTQRDLPQDMREDSKGDSWETSLIVWNEEEILDVKCEGGEGIYGLAVDLGTTTIAGYLMDLESGETVSVNSRVNPQVELGEDVISRISQVTEDEEKRNRAQRIVADQINEMIGDACGDAGVDRNEIYEISMCGNTAMHHLFLGIYPEYVSSPPYPAGRQSSTHLKARGLGIDINPSGYLYCFPVNAGWVGGDNIAVMLTTEIYERPDMSLVVDIGTNGEIALGNEEGSYVCSTAAGPALEGGNIKYGMRAARGAIERVRVNPSDLEPSVETINNSKPRGVCGSGIIDAIAEMRRTGILRSDGRFNEQIKSCKRIREGEEGTKEYVLASNDENSSGSEIVITQKDVREVQKAKGAIQAGARLLMEKLEVEDIDRIFLAGAFGNKIDKSSAERIGLFPNCNPDEVKNIGNAAGSGAQMALMSVEKRREAEEIPGMVEYVEVAGTEEFRKHYLDAIHIPHRDQSLYRE